MKEIGGYFQLELPSAIENNVRSGIYLNSGTSSLEYILRSIPNIETVWIPKYTCPVIYGPFKNTGIKPQFYSVDQNFEIAENIELGKNDYLLITNYFGIKDLYIKKLIQIYKDKLIVDNSQAWYSNFGTDIKAFYSPRKFFGVPDGGIAVIDENPHINLEQSISFDKCSHLLKRIDLSATAGYEDFKINSHSVSSQGIKGMSNLTKAILSSINVDKVKEKRRQNFAFLHKKLAKANKLNLPKRDSFECPLIYPFLTEDPTLRQRLIDNKIYIAKYWPGLTENLDLSDLEHDLINNLIAFPIDQRADLTDMNRIISFI